MKKMVSCFLSVCLAVGAVLFSMGAFLPSSFRSETAAAGSKTYAADVMPTGGVIHDYVTERVEYSRREESGKYYNIYELPMYMATNMTNACAITAGGAVIGYFDRLYEELIPNHTGIEFMGRYTYGSQDAEVNAMHQDLYRRMGSTSEGTTVNGYVTGLSSYVASKGRTASITKIYRNSKLDQSYMNALASGKLLTIFMDGFSIVNLSGVGEYNGYDEIKHCRVVGGHTVTAYGYRNIKYYDAANRLIEEDCYLYVHTGFTATGLAMVQLNKHMTLDDGYIIDIY